MITRKAYSLLFYRMPVGEFLTILHSFWLHLRFSFKDANPGFEKKRLEYYLVKYCHVVEKGLALPEPRKGFGKDKINNLINKTEYYELKYGVNQIGIMIRDTLREYIGFHKNEMEIFSVDFLKKVNDFIDAKEFQNKGGVKFLKKSDIKKMQATEFEKFLQCRHSVRIFSEEPVKDEVIFKALDYARNTPSVCNRQGWFVHYYKNKSKIKNILHFQNGNAGFTDCIDKLLIVTGSTRAFTRYEHNQLFIDGGLYSMNIMLSLHALGLGSCPLNTCMPWISEIKMKKEAGIGADERVIMIIAVGNLLEEFPVAHSEKFTVSKILVNHF